MDSNTPKSLQQTVYEQAALLGVRRHRPILKVRMHSVDEAYVRGFVCADRFSEGMVRVIGIPVEVDDSVPPGKPASAQTHDNVRWRAFTRAQRVAAAVSYLTPDPKGSGR